MSPIMPALWESAMLPICELCSMLFMLDEPLVILALGFVSVDEFVSLAQLTSLLLTFSVLLLLLGVDNRWVLSFSSRRHLALQMTKTFLFTIQNIFWLQAYLRLENQTWILASGSPIFTARRSLAKTLNEKKKLKFNLVSSSM